MHGNLATGLLVGIALTATDPGRLADEVRAAEAAGLHLVLLDDGPGQPAATGGRGNLDPLESAAFAAALTTRVGLVATAAATHAEPFHLANRISSLDWGSGGRAGWLSTVDTTPARAAAYSAPVPRDRVAAAREADEVVDAVRRLWDSWEDGALVADTAAGRFLDADRLHAVDVRGEFVAVRGPGLMPRPVQGQPVVLARARHAVAGADVALVAGGGPGDLVPAALRARAGGAPRVFAETAPAAPQTADLLRRLAAHVDGVVLRPADVGALLARLGADLPGLVADGVVAPPPDGGTLRDQLGLPRPASRYAVAP